LLIGSPISTQLDWQCWRESAKALAADHSTLDVAQVAKGADADAVEAVEALAALVAVIRQRNY
jgi:hypothetical protein